MHAADLPVALANGFRCCSARLDRNFLRIIQIAPRNSLDLLGHGCRKQSHLTSIGRLVQYPLHFVNKSHAQHFVSFIQYHGPQSAEFQSTLAHVVHQSAGSTDDNLYASFELPNLTAIFLAAVNWQNMKSLNVRRVMLKRFSHLNCQLTSWRQRQNLDVLVLHVDARQ